jgi:hypothetical protein
LGLTILSLSFFELLFGLLVPLDAPLLCGLELFDGGCSVLTGVRLYFFGLFSLRILKAGFIKAPVSSTAMTHM